eukprot:12848932-Heterocapsa_arctica.AAC.1
MADLIAYEIHEELVRVLLCEYHRSSPSGYAQVAIAQLARTDREVFNRLAQLCRDGVKRNAVGDRPLDLALPI